MGETTSSGRYESVESLGKESGRRDSVRPCLQARAGGHRVEAGRCALPFGPRQDVDQGQKHEAPAFLRVQEGTF